jgi:hypothetical protein
MKRPGIAIALAVLLFLQSATAGFSQVSLQYRYGEDPSSSTNGGADRNQQLRQGLNQAFGGASSGVVTGNIGSSFPDASLSQRKIQDEEARAQVLEQRWQQLAGMRSPDPGSYLQRYNETKQIKGLLNYKSDKNPDDLRKWASTDSNFKQKAADVLYDIRTSHSSLPGSKQLQEVGEEAIAQADAASFKDQNDEASLYYSVARASADILIGIDPVTGTLRGLYESVTGLNLITGDELSNLERGIAVFSVVTLGFGGEIHKGIELFGAAFVVGAKDTKAFAQAAAYARFIADKFSLFRGAEKVEIAGPRFIEMLVEAASGPRQRAEQLRATYETVATGITRSHPELYRLDDAFVKNLSLGEATRAEVEAIGQAFVGENATVTAYRQDPSVKIFRSLDERRGYRQPFYKEGLGRAQANLEVFAPPGSSRSLPLSDAHIDIK